MTKSYIYAKLSLNNDRLFIMISDKKFNWVKIDNISVPLELINQTQVASVTGYDQSYISRLMDPKDTRRKNPTALKIVRDAIVLLYSNIIVTHDHLAA